MTQFTQNVAAAFAAVLIVTVSMAEVVTVRPAHAEVVIGPAIA